MATRSCREKPQQLKQRHQLLLSTLLREGEDREDCEA